MGPVPPRNFPARNSSKPASRNKTKRPTWAVTPPSSNSPHWRQALHYYATALLSFVVQILILNLLVFLLVTERPIETAVLNGVAVATGALLNYLAASLWVFSPNRHPLRRHAR